MKTFYSIISYSKLLSVGVLILLVQDVLSQTTLQEQLKYSRVREAKKLKSKIVNGYFKKHSIDTNSFDIYLTVFKKEKRLQVWSKNRKSTKYENIITYKICSSSGVIGPKRREGDMQVPEGFYRIIQYKPWSSYYLSMLLNYPNKSDKILSEKTNPGNNICIHGDCVTIGCIPLTDDKIKELYLICVKALSSGQKYIPITIYPMEFTKSRYDRMICNTEYSSCFGLWEDLNLAYTYFMMTKKMPNVKFLNNGRHKIN